MGSLLHCYSIIQSSAMGVVGAESASFGEWFELATGIDIIRGGLLLAVAITVGAIVGILLYRAQVRAVKNCQVALDRYLEIQYAGSMYSALDISGAGAELRS